MENHPNGTTAVTETPVTGETELYKRLHPRSAPRAFTPAWMMHGKPSHPMNPPSGTRIRAVRHQHGR